MRYAFLATVIASTILSASNVLGASLDKETTSAAHSAPWDQYRDATCGNSGYCWWLCKDAQDWCWVGTNNRASDSGGSWRWLKCNTDADCSKRTLDEQLTGGDYAVCRRATGGVMYDLSCVPSQYN